MRDSQAVQVQTFVSPLFQGQPPHSLGLCLPVPAQKATFSHQNSLGAWDSSDRGEKRGWKGFGDRGGC